MDMKNKFRRFNIWLDFHTTGLLGRGKENRIAEIEKKYYNEFNNRASVSAVIEEQRVQRREKHLLQEST